MTTASTDRLAFLNGVQEHPWDEDLAAISEARGWATNNSDFESYCVDLAFPNNPEGLGGIVLNAIGRSPDNVGIDIAGGTEGVAMQDLLRDGVLGQAIFTNYYDLRSDETATVEGLHHIDGNLVDRSTWEKILLKQEELAPEGLDLVIHRPVGGLQKLPVDFYRSAASLLLNITKPGGVLFLQVPEILIHDDDLGTGELNLGLNEVCEAIRIRDDIACVIPSHVRFEVLPKLIDSVVILKK